MHSLLDKYCIWNFPWNNSSDFWHIPGNLENGEGQRAFAKKPMILSGDIKMNQVPGFDVVAAKKYCKATDKFV